MTFLRTFRRDEKGAVLVTALIFLGAIMAMFATAMTLSTRYTIWNRLQVAADSAAIAGLRQRAVPANVPTEAKRVAELNMGTGAFGNILVNADITLGTWNYSTRTFSAPGTIQNALRVKTYRATRNGNPHRDIFSGSFGIPTTTDLGRVAIAAIAPPPACYTEGIIGSGEIVLGNRNMIDDNFCIHARDKITLGNNNTAGTGAELSTDVASSSNPSLSNISAPANGSATSITSVSNAIAAPRPLAPDASDFIGGLTYNQTGVTARSDINTTFAGTIDTLYKGWASTSSAPLIRVLQGNYELTPGGFQEITGGSILSDCSTAVTGRATGPVIGPTTGVIYYVTGSVRVAGTTRTRPIQDVAFTGNCIDIESNGFIRNTLMLAGKNLNSAAGAQFGAVAATSFDPANCSSISGKIYAGAVGDVNMVSNGDFSGIQIAAGKNVLFGATTGGGSALAGTSNLRFHGGVSIQAGTLNSDGTNVAGTGSIRLNSNIDFGTCNTFGSELTDAPDPRIRLVY